MPFHLKPMIAVAISSLFIFSAGAGASDLTPLRELLCAAMLTSPQFANPSDTPQTTVLKADDLNPLDREEAILAKALEVLRAGGQEFEVLEFSRMITGQENIAKFMDSVRQNAVQLEVDLQATGHLTKRFWDARRIKDFATVLALPVVSLGLTFAGGYHEMSLSPEELSGHGQLLAGLALGVNAFLAMAIKDHFVWAGRYIKSIYSPAGRAVIRSNDAGRAHETDKSWRGMVTSPPDIASSGPSLLIHLPLELANLLLDPPTSGASEKEISNYKELLARSLANYFARTPEWFEVGYRLFLFRFTAIEDQHFIIQTTVYKPAYVPRRPGRQQEVDSHAETMAGAPLGWQGHR